VHLLVFVDSVKKAKKKTVLNASGYECKAFQELQRIFENDAELERRIQEGWEKAVRRIKDDLTIR
jgi:hypothetical protein